jgi:PhzF family phenazine biosynthesis protein
MKINVKKVNVFTESLEGGNPAGVVLDSPDLTDEQMKHVSKVLSVSETAFVFPSKKADYKIRFLSPDVEVDLCGHATIATFFTMALEGVFSREINTIVTQETKSGVLPVDIYFSDETVDRVMMTQAPLRCKDICLDISILADSLNISVDEIDDSLPKQIVSTGLFTLPLCVKSFDILKAINPDFEKIKKLCSRFGVGSFHLFTFDTVESDSIYHSRNFAPVYGVNEDPVTGTANGAVCSYLIKNKIVKDRNLICEQGDVMGRPGRVFVEIDGDVVKVGGKARVVKEREISV